jgi:hypothetical protein
MTLLLLSEMNSFVLHSCGSVVFLILSAPSYNQTAHPNRQGRNPNSNVVERLSEVLGVCINFCMLDKEGAQLQIWPLYIILEATSYCKHYSKMSFVSVLLKMFFV